MTAAYRVGDDMKDSTGNAPLIELDPRKLLGLSQVAKVSGVHRATGRLLNKVGEGPGQPSRLAKLLSKIGGEGGELPVEPITPE